MLPIIQHPKGLTFKVFVQPRSSKNQILGLHGDALKIKLTAPPVNDAANRMCIQYLAKYLEVPRSSLTVISGHHSRTKQILYHCGDKGISEKALDYLKQLIDSLINSQKIP
ncbi:MAG TPA: DUF167 domain-containing protein [Desulfobacterales bacterium]|jgi:hypothetical protein|nr:DUF167 domain-containing protein [Desulfobacterales bacterium]